MSTKKPGGPMTSMMLGEEDKPAPDDHKKPGDGMTSLAIGEEDPKPSDGGGRAGAVPNDNPLGGW